VTAWRPPPWYDRLGGIAWRAVIIAVAAVLLVSGLVARSSVIVPVVLGLLFACGLQPISRQLERRGLRRWLSSLVAVLTLFIVVALVAWLTVRLVVDQWGAISSMLADGQATLEEEAGDQGVDPSTAASIGADFGELASTIAEMLVHGLVQIVPVAAGVVATVLLSFVAAYFFLKDGAAMWHSIVTNLGDFRELTDRTGRRVWATLTGYIIGQTVIAAADATLITIGALLLGVPQLGAVFMLTLFGPTSRTSARSSPGSSPSSSRSATQAWTKGSPCWAWSSSCRCWKATSCSQGSRVEPCVCTRWSSPCPSRQGRRWPGLSACSSPCPSPPPASSHWPSCAPPASSGPPNSRTEPTMRRRRRLGRTTPDGSCSPASRTVQDHRTIRPRRRAASPRRAANVLNLVAHEAQRPSGVLDP
jgi:hypothetical protein